MYPVLDGKQVIVMYQSQILERTRLPLVRD